MITSSPFVWCALHTRDFKTGTRHLCRRATAWVFRRDTRGDYTHEDLPVPYSPFRDLLTPSAAWEAFDPVNCPSVQI